MIQLRFGHFLISGPRTTYYDVFSNTHREVLNDNNGFTVGELDKLSLVNTSLGDTISLRAKDSTEETEAKILDVLSQQLDQAKLTDPPPLKQAASSHRELNRTGIPEKLGQFIDDSTIRA